MYDLDIQRIIFSLELAKEKTIFIERAGKTAAQIENSIQSDFGEVYPIGLEKFIESIKNISLSYVPEETDDSFLDFAEIFPPEQRREFRDDNIYDLWLKGDIDHEFIWDRVNGNASHPYFIIRKEHAEIIAALQANANTAVVYSDMANGKTLLLYGLACQLRASGHRVFWLNDDVIAASREVDRICSLEGKNVVIIENYDRKLDIVRTIAAKRGNNLMLLLSAKRTSHEVFVDDLARVISPNETVTFEVDHLDNDSLQQVDTILSTYKLWAERDAWNKFQKMRYLAGDCEGQMSSILLDVIKSPNVQKKFHTLFQSFKSNGKFTDVIVASSVLTILGYHRLRDTVISELVRNNYIHTLEFKQNPIAQDLLRIGNGQIIPRSSVLAKYGLTTFMDARSLIDRLISIAQVAHDLGSDQLYFGIYKDLVTFSTLQRMLPIKGKRDALIRFYEALKNLSAAQNHPHFWLQYAIARLATDRDDDLEKARLYLEAAYAQAKLKKNYHTRHMDNVKARYLIRHSTTIPELNVALVELIDGHKLLLAQARTEKTYAPFNVASNYLNFYNAKKDSLHEDARKLLRRYADEILEFIPDLPARVKTERAVVQCEKDLRSMLADLNASADSGRR